MQKTTLIFPDTVKMAEFILNERVAKVQTDCSKRSIEGALTPTQVTKAIRQYGAKLSKAKSR